MDELAKPALEILRNKDLQFVPDKFDKTYTQWLENIRDWCISRQLWWGHQIPAYYCQECGEVVVAKEMPKECKCGHTHFKQDEDVLDTWFSSALWPFSTLGWPHNTEELNYYYPTSVLVTGYDIIFFWVVRMAFAGMFCMGETPFKHVLIHGLVRDSEGRKMSKSLGNGIDPLEVIDQYGADALRFMLATGNSHTRPVMVAQRIQGSHGEFARRHLLRFDQLREHEARDFRHIFAMFAQAGYSERRAGDRGIGRGSKLPAATRSARGRVAPQTRRLL